MIIYIAKIIKRIEVTKMIYDGIWKREIETHFMFDETVDYTCHHDIKDAETSLKEMMGEIVEMTWYEDFHNFMYGSSSKYHSSFKHLDNGNRIDYFAIIEEKELA